MSDDQPIGVGWRRAEITGKIVVPVGATIAAAFAALYWQSERTRAEMASGMTQIAIGILSEDVTQEENQRVLRNWAISVLQNPEAPPPLTEDAADALRALALPVAALDWSDGGWAAMMAGTSSAPEYRSGWSFGPPSMDVPPGTQLVDLEDAVNRLDDLEVSTAYQLLVERSVLVPQRFIAPVNADDEALKVSALMAINLYLRLTEYQFSEDE